MTATVNDLVLEKLKLANSYPETDYFEISA